MASEWRRLTSCPLLGLTSVSSMTVVIMYLASVVNAMFYLQRRMRNLMFAEVTAVLSMHLNSLANLVEALVMRCVDTLRVRRLTSTIGLQTKVLTKNRHITSS